MKRCRFEFPYYDKKIQDYVQYECKIEEEDILESGFCIFHDENYLTDPVNREENERNVRRKLTKKIDQNLSDNEPLDCYAYHLPKFSVIRRRFNSPVNFSDSVFVGGAFLHDVQFAEYADFSGAKFGAKISLSKSKFTEKADFSGTKFMKEASFWGAQFLKEADFSRAKFEEEAGFNDVQFTEKADLSDVIFMKEANFWGAQFLKEANFWGAQFLIADFSRFQFIETPIFAEAQFTEKADFSGTNFKKGVSFKKSNCMRRGGKYKWK